MLKVWTYKREIREIYSFVLKFGLWLCVRGFAESLHHRATFTEMLRMTSSSFLFSEWTSPPPGQTHCLKEADQALRGLTHSLQPHTLSDSSSPRFTILPAPQGTHTR